MKKKIYPLLLIGLLCFITSKAFSQSYKSIFGHTSTSWEVILHGYCDFIVSRTVTATIDTTVNFKNYKVISGLGGFLREDTTMGKVWFFDTLLQREYLVMDMTLNLGDTSYIYTWDNDSIPMRVDSVYYVNGLKYIRFNSWISMCGPVEKIKYIEGSGANASYNYNGNLNSVDSYMLCHFKDGVKVSGTNFFGDTCYVFEVGIAENKSDLDKVKIFPNPAHTYIQINQPENIRRTFNIYDLTGRIVLNRHLTNSTEIIDISGLTGGTYIYKLDSENNRTRNGKIIILN